jgi:hypothetical protein
MLATAILTTVLMTPACSWDNPGANRYTGNVPASVQHYSDIPLEPRNKLQKRLETRQYDEIATITREKIEGKSTYTDLREMHFGKNQVCQTVSREKWADSAKERGLIYCEDGYCIIVPTICGNVSRITKSAPITPPATTNGSAGAGRSPYTPAVPPPLSIAVPEAPTFDSVVKADMLPPPLIHQDEPYWFPPILSIPPIGDSGCCSRPIIKPPMPPIPEPSTFYMAIIGLLVLGLKRR